MLSSIGNSLRVTSTGSKLPFLAPNPAHFLATESGTTSDANIRLRQVNPLRRAGHRVELSSAAERRHPGLGCHVAGRYLRLP